ncbi:fibroblast growth factor 19 isoform X1 [Falco naumanni]|uniref:fibroblast growth factor 19 isoform X1 n=1 Tax=Falco naumanni TaxID=148594 RepID=UPI001ADEAAF2|nr:fibroblast growth factor 19 isoform X1 [Falco naumanni]
MGSILELDAAESIGLITRSYKRPGGWLRPRYIPAAPPAQSAPGLPSAPLRAAPPPPAAWGRAPPPAPPPWRCWAWPPPPPCRCRCPTPVRTSTTAGGSRSGCGTSTPPASTGSSAASCASAGTAAWTPPAARARRLRYSTEDCSFEEEIRPDGYNVYKSKKYGISVSLSSAKQRQQFKGKDFLPLSHFLPMINTVPVESTDFGEYGDYSQAFEPEVYSSPLETDSMDPFGITSKLSPVKSPSFQK